MFQHTLKMVHVPTHVENNMGSEVEVTSCSKVRKKKRVLDGILL